MFSHQTTAVLFLLLAFSSFSQVSSQRDKRQIVFPSGDEEDERNPGVPSGEACLTPDRRQGECVVLTNCPSLRRLNFNRLRRFFCGFVREEPKVCCPLDRIVATTPRGRVIPPSRVTTLRQPQRRPSPTPTRRPAEPIRSSTLPSSRSNVKPAFLPRDCGSQGFAKTRIVGGREADKGSWPWMAVVYQEKRGVKSPDCGGALVTSRHVITAAHCVVGRGATTLSPNVLSVRLGEHDLYNNSEGMNPIDLQVESVTRHPDFDPRTYKNDIAVLRLSGEPVRFGKRGNLTNIAPVCLPYDSLKDQDLTGRRAFVAGWGTTSFNGPSSPVLREAAFDIQDQEFCKKAYEKELPITEEYMCAGTADGSKDSCQGDSGGPLMSIGKENRYYLVGIVSFGKLCAQPGYPGVYTRVTNYLEWLRTTLAT